MQVAEERDHPAVVGDGDFVAEADQKRAVAGVEILRRGRFWIGDTHKIRVCLIRLACVRLAIGCG